MYAEKMEKISTESWSLEKMVSLIAALGKNTCNLNPCSLAQLES